ncbi:MAG TPA: RcnB family protein [Rhodanobacter sp.]|nr:RcnB family protein [Rhodanobacter sp.]
MKFVTRLLLAFALLGTSSVALADRGHGDHDRRGQRHAQRDHRQQGRHVERRHVDQRGHGQHDNRRDNRRYGYHRADRYDYRRHDYRPVYPHYRHTRWVRGHRYHGPTYVVRDYGYYRLRPPPRGYHWVRANNDFLLVAITTGIILDLALR